MMNRNIKSRWWFLAKLIAIVAVIVWGCCSTGFIHKTGATFILTILMIIFAWAIACTIVALREAYEKDRKRKRDRF